MLSYAPFLHMMQPAQHARFEPNVYYEKKKENVDWLDSAIVFIAFIFHSFSSSLVAVHFISSLTRSRSIIITNSLYVKCIRVSIRSSAAFATAVAVLCSSSHRQFWIFDEFAQDDMVFYFCCYRINSVRRVSPLASAILKLIPEFESREHRKKNRNFLHLFMSRTYTYLRYWPPLSSFILLLVFSHDFLRISFPLAVFASPIIKIQVFQEVT